jgi:hypothetical protein
LLKFLIFCVKSFDQTVYQCLIGQARHKHAPSIAERKPISVAAGAACATALNAARSTSLGLPIPERQLQISRQLKNAKPSLLAPILEL